MKWKDRFNRKIVARGYRYFKDGHVIQLAEGTGTIHAVVSGSEYYDVIIRIEDNQLLTSCTCPYAEEGHLCKHVAAVLFQMEMEEINHVRYVVLKHIKEKMEQESKADLICLINDLSFSSEPFEILIQKYLAGDIVSTLVDDDYDYQLLEVHNGMIFDFEYYLDEDDYGYYDDTDLDGWSSNEDDIFTGSLRIKDGFRH